jgi:hypothetical protein
MSVSRLLKSPIQIHLSEKKILPLSRSVRPNPHNLVGGYVRKVATQATFGGPFPPGTTVITVQHGG